jgi:putative ABC transport system permease protein
MVMIMAALRDLQWRRRRVVVAVVATALVFAMSLLLSGLSESFGNEASSTLASMQADAWVTTTEALGPFTGPELLSAGVVEEIRASPGVTAAGGMLFTRSDFRNEQGKTADINLFGAEPDQPGSPKVSQGRPLRGAGEAVISSEAGVPVGGKIVIRGQELTVVGTIDGGTLFAGTPNVFVTLPDAQALVFYGQPAVTTVAMNGSGSALPPTFRANNAAQAKDDLMRPILGAKDAIGFVTILLWIVAACIVASVVYLSALERQRDFAVFKATGSSNASIGAGLAAQSVIIALAASVVALLVALLLTPLFPLPVSVPARSAVLLPVLAVVIGLVASLGGLRRSAKVDPALAFGGP